MKEKVDEKVLLADGKDGLVELTLKKQNFGFTALMVTTHHVRTWRYIE